MKRIVHRFAAIAWPAFLAAAVLEIAVFALVDPAQIAVLVEPPLALSTTAIYSLAFFGFWLAVGAACALTVLLERSADELNL
jgi:hypothetical protein